MTATLRIKNDRYYAVVSYKDGSEYKQKWVALGLPAKNNKRRAEAMLEEVKREYSERYSMPNGDVPLVQYIRQWLIKKKPYIELSTWEGYQIYSERHIIPYFEPLNLTLRDVKPQHVRDYYNFKYTSGRLDGKEGGLSIPSIKKHAIVLKEVFNDAVMEEYMPRNPAAGVKLPAKDVATRQKRFLTSEQANEMLKIFKGHPLEALVYTTLYYGLRRSEVLGLRWRAVDFENGTLSINHTVVKNVTIVEKDCTKTQSSFHTYLLIDDVRDRLLAQREWQKQNKKDYGQSYHDSDYIFTWPDGKLFRPDYITHGFRKALVDNGFPEMRFHDLRHSTASILYDKGWDMKDIQSWLRHSSIEVTSDIYTHISEDRKIQLANKLNNTFKLGEGDARPETD